MKMAWNNHGSVPMRLVHALSLNALCSPDLVSLLPG
jgi:hypothetical protein